jgi:hypothetical protein
VLCTVWRRLVEPPRLWREIVAFQYVVISSEIISEELLPEARVWAIAAKGQHFGNHCPTAPAYTHSNPFREPASSKAGSAMQTNQFSEQRMTGTENRNDSQWQNGLRYAAAALETRNIVVPHSPDELQQALEWIINEVEAGHQVPRSDYERISLTIELMGWGIHDAAKDEVARQLYDRFKALHHQIMGKRLLTDNEFVTPISGTATDVRFLSQPEKVSQTDAIQFDLSRAGLTNPHLFQR